MSGSIATRFVLIQTSHAGNVGAVARAMKTMGFEDLVLVRPRWPDVLTRDEAVERASGASDVLARARVVQTVEEALDGMTHVCATAMTPRDFGPPTRSPRAHLPTLIDGAQKPSGVAFLMGSERYGMKNEDVYRSHVCLQIPVNPTYGSLNLAAAVQVLAYEWRQCLGGFETVVHKPSAEVADAQALAGVLAHWQEALVAVGFLDPSAPKKLMPRLQQLLNRAAIAPEEVHVLRGVAKAMIEVSQGRTR